MPPPPPPVGTITGLELYDGATDADLGPLTNGETITETSGQTFAIRGSTSGVIGSVQYQLNGTVTETDDAAPYDVFGTESGGNSQAATISVGSNTLTATPYSGADAQGAIGSVYSIQFSVIQQTPVPPPPVVPPPPTPPPPPPPPPVGTVTGFEVYDGVTGKDLGSLTNGETITETSGQTFAIRGSTSGAIGSVEYQLDGTTTETDNGAPYDVFGTNSDGSSEGATISVGSHSLTATPYGSVDAQGSTGSIYSIQFLIARQTPVPPPPVVPPPPPPTPPPPPVGTVTGLELYDGATGKDLGPLTNGETITETSGQTFAIRGSTLGAIGSVQYQLDGTTTETDNSAPFDVFGTSSSGSSQGATISIGSHTLKATPYSAGAAQGTVGSVYTVQFTVAQPPPAPSAPPIVGSWNQVFDDEFNGTSLNPIWHTAQYWNTTTTVVGQGELEAYNGAADTVSGGQLHITATPNASYGAQYLSGLVMTGGIDGNSSQSTFSFKYGYIEVSAKIPKGQGLWPAIWMMPAGYQDSNGEIDVMENLGGDTTTAYGTVHMHGGSKQSTWHGVDLSAGFHTYAVDWQPNQITWYIDGIPYGTVTNTALIPTVAMYPIMNLAVGGAWGGPLPTPAPSSRPRSISITSESGSRVPNLLDYTQSSRALPSARLVLF